jgi:hypothetical protein
MKADAGGREVLSADFADDADEGKEICAIGVICGFPIPQFAILNSKLSWFFSGFHFGMDDWGIWRLNFI